MDVRRELQQLLLEAENTVERIASGESPEGVPLSIDCLLLEAERLLRDVSFVASGGSTIELGGAAAPPIDIKCRPYY